jgi:molecular chaperone GrpE
MTAAPTTEKRDRRAAEPEPDAREAAEVAVLAASAPVEDTEPAGTDEPASDALTRLAAERDEYLHTLQRLQAEYDNYRRRVQRERADLLDRGAQRLAERLLEVLDAFDQAVQHGTQGAVDAVAPLRRSLQDALAAGGLRRLDPEGAPFDPAEHHAIAHEAIWHEAIWHEVGAAGSAGGEADADQPATVVEVLRPGYRWNDRLLRPALVKVRG